MCQQMQHCCCQNLLVPVPKYQLRHAKSVAADVSLHLTDIHSVLLFENHQTLLHSTDGAATQYKPKVSTGAEVGLIDNNCVEYTCFQRNSAFSTCGDRRDDNPACMFGAVAASLFSLSCQHWAPGPRINRRSVCNRLKDISGA